MMRRPQVLVGALVGLSALSCASPTHPLDVSGTYGLATIDGHAPPALVGGTVQADRYLVGGWLELQSGGNFIMGLSTMLDTTRTGAPLVDSLTYVYWGSFSVDGRSIALSWSGSTGSRTFTGTADATAVTLTVDDSVVLTTRTALGFTRSSTQPVAAALPPNKRLQRARVQSRCCAAGE